LVSERAEDVKPGDVGEVWIRGDNVFKGYWQMPEKTRESFEAGWFKTGDLGYQDPADGGRLYLVGRAKELIITGGYNVYPKEIESVLEQHEAVQEVAVVGIPDEDYGEKVIAIVVPRGSEHPVTSEEMIAFCKKHLASYKSPKQIFFVDHLPRNAMGKIQKEVLQKKYSKPDK
jgi:malonyl-CoA/methylmalonyl-CoA synthetase